MSFVNVTCSLVSSFAAGPADSSAGSATRTRATTVDKPTDPADLQRGVDIMLLPSCANSAAAAERDFAELYARAGGFVKKVSAG